MNTCLQWFFSDAENNRPQAENLSSDHDDIKVLNKVLATIWHYENSKDAMNTLWNGLLDYRIESENLISIEYPDELSKRMELGEWLKDSFNPVKPFSFPGWTRLLRSCNARLKNGRSLDYQLNGAQFKGLLGYVSGLYMPYQQLPEEWDFGGYTVGEFRKLWTALLSFAYFHASMHDYWAKTKRDVLAAFPLNTCIPIDTKKNWVSRLSRWSSLQRSTVELILADMTYQPSMHCGQNKKPDASSQPFFVLDTDRLALSCFLVTCTSFEKSMWDLLSVLRNDLFGTLSGLKEKVWREELADKFRQKGLLAFTNIEFKFGKKGDVDLLILDPQTYQGLACELKWLVGPDRIKDVELRHIAKAFTQVEKNKAWIDGAPEQVARHDRIKMEVDEFKKYEIHHLAIGRNSMVNGTVRHANFPLVYEGVFNWLIFTRSFDLSTAYSHIANYTYLPVLGLDFSEERVIISHAGMNFRLTNFKPLRHWEPAL